MTRVFFSYSHLDEQYRDRLEKNLAMLKREGLIEAWHDRRITPGAPLDTTISEYLESSEIILLLVSPDFLASDYCYDIEMRRALERHEAGEAVVIPVIVRPCDWHTAPFGHLSALPTDGKPITKWPDLDDAFLDVTKGIRAAMLSASRRSPLIAHPTEHPTSGVPRSTLPRSSNLRVARVFSEQEHDDFLRQAFEYIERYFENSVSELIARNPGIEGRFRKIDADRFTCVVYRAGKQVSGCTIWFDGRRLGGSGIGYVANDSGQTGTLNEGLSAAADKESLYLKAMGMSRLLGGSTNEQRLTMEGGSELFWGLFIAPLQRAWP
jgi:hypothetical protein